MSERLSEQIELTRQQVKAMDDKKERASAVVVNLDVLRALLAASQPNSGAVPIRDCLDCGQEIHAPSGQPATDITHAMSERCLREGCQLYCAKPVKSTRPTWESTHCPYCGVNMKDLDQEASAVSHLTGACKPATADPVEALTFYEFSRVNRQRCESKEGFSHQLDSWSTSDWFTALFGELGEAANVAKKLNRIRDSVGLNANKGATAKALQVKLRQELGDGFVYLDLLAQSLGFSIADAAVEVFNAKSDELNCPIRMAALRASRTAGGGVEPWLFAIEECSEDGKWSWHDGEQCVFGDRESAQDEVGMLNDDVEDWQGSPYRVVPLYRAALAASASPAAKESK